MNILAAYEVMKAFLENRECNDIVIPAVRCYTKSTRGSMRTPAVGWGMQSRESRPCPWAGIWSCWKDLSKAGLFSFAQAMKMHTPITGPEHAGDSREANEDSPFRWLKVKCVKVFTGLTAPVRLDFLPLTRAPTTGSDFSPLISLNLGLRNGNLTCK